MDKSSSQLRELFDRLEVTKTLSETDISTEIERVVAGLREASSEPSEETRAEALAFGFVPKRSGELSGWGTYFGPMAVWKSEDGRTIEQPNLQQMSPEILDYWDGRQAVAAHPVLRARYADLLWDFAKALNRQAEIRHANAAIDAYVEAMKSVRYDHKITAITYAGRALSLSISTTDSDRIEKVRDTIIQLEGEGRQIELPGTWGFAFDLLVENKKSRLTNEQEENLINDLEQILQNVVDAPSGPRDPFTAEYAAMRLARYYRRANR
ncbi:MAG TPA: hypothetical protein VEX43_12770, partial [Chthoniobacterales bacterium]|nr:hypothetical protein [Chthoniobacterales bacterium]